MVRTPLDIIVEIVLLILISSISTMLAVFKLLGDLFASLLWTSQRGFAGFMLALIIGGLFVFFFWKYFLKETVSVVKLLLLFGAFVVILIFVLYLFLLIF